MSSTRNHSDSAAQPRGATVGAGESRVPRSPLPDLMDEEGPSGSTDNQSSSASSGLVRRRSTNTSRNGSGAAAASSADTSVVENGNSATASDESNEPGEKPNTRGRNGVRKTTNRSSPSGEQHLKANAREGKFPSMNMDTCAAMLSSVDKRAHSRTLLWDANQVLEALVFPMSFPWAHPLDPHARIMPRDIDEMPEILAAGEVAPFHGNAPGKQGDSATVKSRFPCNQLLARRSVDPGVIEFTTISQASLSHRSSVRPLKRNDRDDEDVRIPGEPSLRMFHEVQARKRQRVSMEQECKKTTLVSVRLGSTSSRSTIFEKPDDDSKRPLLLAAELPQYIQDGRKMMFLEAKILSDELGSYNCRTLPVAGKPSDRAYAGRNRLVWTQKDPCDSSQRAYRSILTGARLEAGTQRRPKEVMVGIRVNGFLLTADKLVVNKYVSGISCQTGDSAFAYSKKCVDEAVGAAFATRSSDPDSSVGNAQCTLNREKFLATVMKDRKLETVGLNANWVQKIQKPFEIHPFLRVTPPKIECLSTEEGLQRVVCVESGTFDASQSNVAAALLDEASKKKHACSVCWADSRVASAPENELLECSECSVLVHQACYGGKRPRRRGIWKCGACVDFRAVPSGNGNSPSETYSYRRNRRGLKCELCPQSGGSICRRKSGGGWVHDVCRIWCNPKIAPTTSQTCALCSETSTSVVQCVGVGCKVSFHPMCALLASQAASLNQKSDAATETAAERDAFLCTQYSLSMIDACVSQQTGSIPVASNRLLPVGFCGHHNPNRQADFSGLYPGGGYLADAMRVPPLAGSRKNPPL